MKSRTSSVHQTWTVTATRGQSRTEKLHSSTVRTPALLHKLLWEKRACGVQFVIVEKGSERLVLSVSLVSVLPIACESLVIVSPKEVYLKIV